MKFLEKMPSFTKNLSSPLIYFQQCEQNSTTHAYPIDLCSDTSLVESGSVRRHFRLSRSKAFSIVISSAQGRYLIISLMLSKNYFLGHTLVFFIDPSDVICFLVQRLFSILATCPNHFKMASLI